MYQSPNFAVPFLLIISPLFCQISMVIVFFCINFLAGHHCGNHNPELIKQDCQSFGVDTASKPNLLGRSSVTPATNMSSIWVSSGFSFPIIGHILKKVKAAATFPDQRLSIWVSSFPDQRGVHGETVQVRSRMLPAVRSEVHVGALHPKPSTSWPHHPEMVCPWSGLSPAGAPALKGCTSGLWRSQMDGVAIAHVSQSLTNRRINSVPLTHLPIASDGNQPCLPTSEPRGRLELVMVVT